MTKADKEYRKRVHDSIEDRFKHLSKEELKWIKDMTDDIITQLEITLDLLADG